MASSGPLGSNFTIREAPGFLERAIRLVGGAKRWDHEIGLNFYQRLCHKPDYGEVIVDGLRAISLLSDPPLTVYYLVIEDDRIIELAAIEEV